MIDVKVELEGDRAIAVHFRGAGARADAAIEKAIGRIALKLMRESVQKKLSGQVLKRQTGTLARSVTQSVRVYNTPRAIVGTVGVADITGNGGRAPVKYGRAHEYGFSGTVTVKEHLRQIRQQGSFKRVKTSASNRFGVYRKVRGELTGTVATVRTHTRKMNIPERSFLRSALDDLLQRGVPREEIERALADALR